MIQAEVSREGNRRVLELAKKHKVRTFFNSAPGDRNTDKSMLALSDIICMNENEVEFITTIPQRTLDDAKRAASEVLAMGPQYVIITLGSKGCILASNEDREIVHVPARQVAAVDTTGAGDCFCGSLAYFLVEEGLTVKEAVYKSVRVASLSVLRKGTQSSFWTRSEIECEYPDLLK
ncbi:ribokinase domain protein [Dictyocaulus viviparus]|uniref:Ribokinase domain protein n=1 Tax=Dictyocaulus viviparus TaxID=29172 RepID=A0A0D8XZ03_DICVI|nr:ribokinase domain protein [Dictyocaulus viviparus]